MTFRARWTPAGLWLRPLPARSSRLRALLPLLAAALLEACASAPTRVLIALPPAAVPEQLPDVRIVSAPPPVLLVRRLIVPEYMAAPKVRYWSGTATLAEWPDTYWAERIEIGMAREFVSAMRRRLPGWTICDATCGDTAVDMTLKVELLRLDTVRHDQSLSARSQTELSASKSARFLSPTHPWARSFTIRLTDDTAQAQARAMSDLLAALADEAVAAVQNARPPVLLGGSGVP